ncbi:unnamed protein product [Lactuca virosa]|uniref:Vacuolar protein sorting-associated protein Ist1 n=1 Tax=Lactuca virosa TaxID=75947 RepID=A0AAU9M6G5_9ASTR|nr:unnamed protein product [Lactuca virosa]
MRIDMFEFIFGWRKASKCKKLIRKVHCRLSLLKNKRCCIVRQIRNDVAELIKHGHYQSAFNRVDQIYKDECIVNVYDLLANFCEFISLQLSYIRRNKDCPNDIKEAISTLIFASARCGDVPELLQIRKLFRDRYGERFEATALEFGPGNLVNSEIREKLSIIKVPNEVKYKLMEEITTSVLQTGPLALEFTSELHRQASKGNTNRDVQGTGNNQIAHVDFDHLAGDNDRWITDRFDAESSSENSTTDMPEEIVYLDDIEEFQSPLNNGTNGKDQRVFVFRSSVVVPVVESRKNHRFIEFDFEKSEGLRIETKGSRKSRKRSVSSDIECSGYYGKTSQRRRASDENRKRSAMHSPRISSPLSGHENIFVKHIGEVGKCSRAITMPSMRLTKCLEENVVRSNSFPVQPSSPHVHPKLPDYDELAAKFMALKKENLQKQK